MNEPEKQPHELPEHLLEHEGETHIHNPDADRTALEIWVRKKLNGGPAAWGPWLAGLVLAVSGVAILSQGSTGGKSGENAWTKLLTATSANEYVDIANEANTGAAAAWSSYLAANQFYNQAIASLLVNRETVDLNLTRAKEAYEKAVARASGIKEDELARMAELGIARTLEMQGKLTEAIEGYDKVAKAAGDSAIGKKAAGFAELLKKPEAKEFYQALAAFKPEPVTNPGLGGFGLPNNHPPLDGPTINTQLPALPSPGDMLKDLAPPPANSPATNAPAGDSLKDLAPPPASKPAEAAKPAEAEKKADTPKK